HRDVPVRVRRLRSPFPLAFHHSVVSTPRLHSPPSPELAYVVLGSRTPIGGHPPLARSHIRRQAAPQGARDPPLPHRATPAAATPPRPNPSLIGQLKGKETGQWDMLRSY
ncbi:unnamed protein product, partial [Urochloa humidicola]